MQSPRKGEPLVWAGAVEKFTYKVVGEKVELEWICRHMAFKSNGPEAIRSRPIKVHDHGAGYFLVNLITEMPVEKAKEYFVKYSEHKYYLVAGGTFEAIVSRDDKNVVFLYTEKMDVSRNLVEISVD